MLCMHAHAHRRAQVHMLITSHTRGQGMLVCAHLGLHVCILEQTHDTHTNMQHACTCSHTRTHSMLAHLELHMSTHSYA